MRILATLIFIASLVAAVLVITAPAKAGWSVPQSLDPGHSPRVRLTSERPVIAYAKGDSRDPHELLMGEGNEPLRRIRVPAAGRVVAFDVAASGRLVALREVRAGRGKPQRILALEGRRWRALSSARRSAVDARLAVAASGAAVAAWLQYEGSRVFVHAAVRRPGTSRFGRAQRISGATSRAPQPLSLAVDDSGNAVVAFAERRDLFMWRSGAGAVRIHDTTDVTAGAFATVAAIRGVTAVVGFTRLEDREPPEYRAAAATWSGVGEPAVETVAADVSALDLAADVSSAGVPVLLTAPIGPPHAVDVHLRRPVWARTHSVAATEAPSALGLEEGVITWTEGTTGFASFAGATRRLGRAYALDAATYGDQALAVWDQGPARPLRVATFTP